MRTARVTVGDSIYHVINRSNGRVRMFDSDNDYKDFGNIVIQPSHLYHSVGEVGAGVVIDMRDATRLSDIGIMIDRISHPVFLVSHDKGEGTFGFLKALPHHVRNGVVLIAHPEHREHDHLQYSVYEDRRLNMVIHCDERMLTGITSGDRIEVTSNGKTASLNIKEK